MSDDEFAVHHLFLVRTVGPADVSGVGWILQHVPDGGGGPLGAAGGEDASCIQKVGDGVAPQRLAPAVGLRVPNRVELKDLPDYAGGLRDWLRGIFTLR